MDNEKTSGAVDVKTETSISDATQALSEVTESTATDYSGKVLGGYQLVRMIAEGGMGVVYEAIQLNLSRKVAVKILNEELAARPEFIQRFQREAKAAAALNHPNMVQVHDFCQTEDSCYLVMEYVEGQDLAEYSEANGKLPIALGLELVEQAAMALKAAAEKSIIHRDIKPSNLMLTPQGQVKVSDLGLAKMLNETSDLTVTGVGMGSPYFMAPEQASDASEVDQRVDIYSLGITLLYLLTGKRPFDGATPFSVILAHANKPLPTGADLGTKLPAEIEALIQKMAAKNPLERYPNYEELLSDLRRVKAGYPPAFVPERTGRKTVPLTTVVVCACLAALFAFGGFVLLTWKGKGRTSEKSVAMAPLDQRGDIPPSNEERFDRRQDLAERPLRPEEMRGPEQMRGPDEPDMPRARQGGGSIPLPLGRLPRPELASLPDGPVSTMLAQADAYAAKHPQEFRDVVDRYRQVLNKARGTPQERPVGEKLRSVVELHQGALRKNLREFEQKMDEELRAGKPQAAYDVWKSFPQSLRTFESDEQIVEILQQKLPAGFMPR